jgi:hypothetical protein
MIVARHEVPGLELGHNSELTKACCEMSRRDDAIVAWHEVPGTTPAQKESSRRDGVICAGVGADSMIRVMQISNTKTD